jgi:hypothetical protein
VEHHHSVHHTALFRQRATPDRLRGRLNNECRRVDPTFSSRLVAVGAGIRDENEWVGLACVRFGVGLRFSSRFVGSCAEGERSIADRSRWRDTSATAESFASQLTKKDRI